ncbi:MAG: hypothetical protein F8N15_00760 [Methanobacterium sp.]|nr:hypothetical protein [Methanobacterium sp.]
MTPHSEFSLGQEFRVPYPFVEKLGQIYNPDTLNFVERRTGWNPGVHMWTEHDGSTADAMGAMILTVVDIHRPGKYHTRVFYTRKWIDPDGKEFGSANLRWTTVTAFKRLLEGYRYAFELEAA